MLGQMIPQQNPQTLHELTPRDDTKKVVSEVLKRVDQLIRKGELDLAQLEIKRAKELDPRNVYAHAMEERITTLLAEVKCVEKTHSAIESVQAPVLKEDTLSEESAPIESQTLETIQANEISTTSSPMATAIPVPCTNSNPAEKNKEETQQERVLDRSIELRTYRMTLVEAWSDGSLTEDELRQLQELRTLLEISDAEHEGIEKNVKRECYKNAIIRQLSCNPAKLSNEKSLADLRGAFQISEEEHLQIQMQLMNVIQHKQRDKILVVDDDMRLLELLSASLEDNGFDVTALPTSDEAFALLRKFTPDLILCDINLETSTMGGFTFYEKLQELKNIQSIPFVFLTGLTDEALVRTGKELGVDDYLMKPISEQTLVSTLRGKLKRFKQLKKIVGAPLHGLAA